MTPAATAPALVELALRRPDFDASGTAVVLSDGQSWVFPVVKVTHFHFVRGTDGKTQLADGFDLGDEWFELHARLTDANTVSQEAIALFDCADHLLMRQYNLPDGATTRLLRRSMGDLGFWPTIYDIATGRAVEQPATTEAPKE